MNGAPCFFMLSKTGKCHKSAPSAEERGLKTEKSFLCESPILVFRPLYESAILRFRRTNKSVTFRYTKHRESRFTTPSPGVTFRYPVSIRTLNFEESFSLRGLRFELSACRNTELNFEFCCPARDWAFLKFEECCVARVLSARSILSLLDFSRFSTTSAVLRWLVMLVLSNLYRCMFIEFYFLSKYSGFPV